jgi:hypothetical protein
MSPMKFLSTFSARVRWTPAQRTHATTVIAKLRELAPYAVMELLLPGGSLMALLLWFYRRQKKAPLFATHEILSFL